MHGGYSVKELATKKYINDEIEAHEYRMSSPRKKNPHIRIRTSFYAENQDIVFAPSFNQYRDLLNASYDCTPAIIKYNQLYLPCEWLIENYPEDKETFLRIIKLTKEAHYNEKNR